MWSAGHFSSCRISAGAPGLASGKAAREGARREKFVDLEAMIRARR
jgi:hypothetical protein